MPTALAPDLEIVIPVYNEGANILSVLRSLAEHVRTPFRVLIAFDHDDDDTLVAIDAEPTSIEIVRVKNRGQGAFGAVMTGFAESKAPYVLVFPADDDYNAPRIDALVARARAGAEIVAASRFMPGGTMVGAPALKAVLIRTSAFALFHLARIPTHDPSNGLRLFSRRVLQTIRVESTIGFTYSIELLVKAHRLGWPIEEVPFTWYERKAGKSRFHAVKWAPAYLRWFFYGFATTWLGRGPESVPLELQV
ncbi:MAG TPA: glycosyltransferase [Polyangiales bacterium]|jgi:dolichol-phosphate mannosyltransferase|nr:glycosyltransferase [Polyangiales bacterium]